MQVNPSQEFIGMKLVSDKPVEVNFRKGKKNVIICSEIECTKANATGRRLGTRRVYFEHFEKMGDRFGIDIYDN